MISKNKITTVIILIPLIKRKEILFSLLLLFKKLKLTVVYKILKHNIKHIMIFHIVLKYDSGSIKNSVTLIYLHNEELKHYFIVLNFRIN